MSLTLRAHGTTATVCDPGSIEHTHRPIMFGASLLWIERGPLPTTQRAIRLREKVLSPKTSSSRCTCPLWRSEGGPRQRRIWGELGLSLRGGKTR
jgi:hypothetical protein